MKRDLFSALAALIIASLLQAVAQNDNQTPGSVVDWGWMAIPRVDPGTRFSAIAAGGQYNLALQSDGTVVAWGANGNGQSTVPPALNGVVAIAAGVRHSLALQSDGTVVAWGYNEYGQSTVPAALNGVVAIAAGVLHSLALQSDGTVVAWGDNEYGQSTVPAALNSVVAIAAGGYHSLALVREQPRLEISAGQNALALSWPATAGGYVVESTRALATPVWETTTNAPAILADRHVLTNSWSGDSRFFRLRRQ